MEWILIGAGLFSIVGAALDWNLFMESHKARPLVTLLGRDGARAFYMLFGVALITAGVLAYTGIILKLV